MLPKCEQCSGTGKTDCVTCGCCGETVELNATITCPDCEGNGETLWDVKVDFGHHHLNAFYLEKLLKLPGVRLAANNDPAGVMAIKFDGGEGVLMPMRKN